MAIADGYEAWLDKVQALLKSNAPNASIKDFDPIQLFRAYENGTLARDFADNPNGPLVPPKGLNLRFRRPILASRKPYLSFILVIAATIATLSIDQAIIEHLIISAKDDTQALHLAISYHHSPQEVKEIQRSIGPQISLILDRSDDAYQSAINLVTFILSFQYAVLMWLWTSLWLNQMRLDYKAHLKTIRFVEQIFGWAGYHAKDII